VFHVRCLNVKLVTSQRVTVFRSRDGRSDFGAWNDCKEVA